MNKRILQIIILCFLYYGAHSQTVITDEQQTHWGHFEKVTFKMNGIEAWYIKPNAPVKGNPWVWRAHFPNWHTQMDSILLERGLAIAYINTNNLYGQSKAMMIWDDFYNYLVTQKNFAPKVALEGVSRGGLYVYGWAKRNPTKVNCIYAEAPVCDFKSWPGGKGMGQGSKVDWDKLLKVYHFSEEEALKSEDIPINNLEALAAFKVPILHVIGLKDSIVPPKENTMVLIKNYINNGGTATVVPMTKGEQSAGGHHFPIAHPEKLADFIYQNSVPVSSALKEEEFIHFYGDLNNTNYRIKKEKEVTVAFLGGSITDMIGWRDKVSTYLQELYPETKFTFINAGIPSLGSVPDAFRLKTDVLDKGRIDLMFIESAVNDRVNGTSDEQQRCALEGIVRQAYRVNPHINLVMMAFADDEKVADYKENKVPLEVKVDEDIAEHYQLSFINLAEAVSKRIEAGELTWADDFKSIHPAPFGQEIYFSEIKTFLQKALNENTSNALKTSKLPLPLQKFAYSGGQYVNLNQAKIIKDFVIDSSWKPNNNIHTRPGFVNVPVLIANKPGAEITFSFKGTAVGIAVLSGPDAGIINYTIDGKTYPPVNLYTQWSKALYLPWYILLEDHLSPQKHTLIIKVSGNKQTLSSRDACHIVHFLVNK